ncbi:MAG: hypothetical protein K0S38_284 [Candidatus Paceibacter sp.]|jgi:hypothetical protein|nr:hypothetical protein [Candidatus Paceibacter sp.]
MASTERDLERAREKFNEADKEVEKATSATRAESERLSNKADAVEKERSNSEEDAGSIFS